MRAHPDPQRLRHSKGDQEIIGRQQEARLLASQPLLGIGLAAERAMPVIAGMIAVMARATIRTGEELAAQGRGAATQEAIGHYVLWLERARRDGDEFSKGCADVPG